jgi:hypothetical protein
MYFCELHLRWLDVNNPKHCHPLNSPNIRSSEDNQTAAVKPILSLTFHISGCTPQKQVFIGIIPKYVNSVTLYVTILSSTLLIRHIYILGLLSMYFYS